MLQRLIWTEKQTWARVFGLDATSSSSWFRLPCSTNLASNVVRSFVRAQPVEGAQSLKTVPRRSLLPFVCAFQKSINLNSRSGGQEGNHD